MSAREGTVALERDGQRDDAIINTPVVAGDRLTTGRGRVEIQFPDGSVLDVDDDSAVELLSPTLLRLTTGRALLTVAGVGDPASAVRYQIDTPAASVRTDSPGEYRIDTSVGRDLATELIVRRGAATFWTDRAALALRAGERSEAFADGAPSTPELINSARLDAFDQWAADRHRDRLTGLSAQYLPRELRAYGASLDQGGSWQYVSPYGYVWYPAVAEDWRPYYDGYWSPVPEYGWVWIGVGRWAWPTHHYGRWGHVHGSWFWIPGRTWSPAWVSWGAAPGYVSWCPLGFDGSPVYTLFPGASDRWRGWVVVPRQSFGFREHTVRHYAIAPQALGVATPFITQATPPVAFPHQTMGRAQPNVGGLSVAGSRGPRQERHSFVTSRPAETAGEKAPTVASPRSGPPVTNTTVATPRIDRRTSSTADRRTAPIWRTPPTEVHRLGGSTQTVEPKQPVQTLPSAARLAPREIAPRAVPVDRRAPMRPAPPLAHPGSAPAQPAAPAAKSAPAAGPPPHQAPAHAAPHAEVPHEGRRAR